MRSGLLLLVAMLGCLAAAPLSAQSWVPVSAGVMSKKENIAVFADTESVRPRGPDRASVWMKSEVRSVAGKRQGGWLQRIEIDCAEAQFRIVKMIMFNASETPTSSEPETPDAQWESAAPGTASMSWVRFVCGMLRSREAKDST